MNYKNGECSKCGEVRIIVRTQKKICINCFPKYERERALAKKKAKQGRTKKMVIGVKVEKEFKNKFEFLKHAWNVKPHYCVECMALGKPKRDCYLREFKTIYVSHTMSVGALKAAEHDLDNVEIMCEEHHVQWETGKRKLMKMYDYLMNRMQEIKSKYYGVYQN